MNRLKMMIVTVLAASIPALAHAGAMVTQTTYSCTDAQGKSTLTNVPKPGANCEALYTAQVPAETAATSAKAAPGTTLVAAASSHSAPVQHASPAEIQKAKAKANTAASNRRNDAVRHVADEYAHGTPQDGNPAVSRRYLKTDRGSYIQQNGMVAQ